MISILKLSIIKRYKNLLFFIWFISCLFFFKFEFLLQYFISIQIYYLSCRINKRIENEKFAEM
ncbi:hypothetical protein BpHYR1_008548 [Brachionus plicatilis]|uniref:Uncharacterized protein n=1 Tax=Brachionus plicatilis TaxID=10195 RepID=A0A3M7T500_BRAPC|nr:hypothetical protein BpHYR1_008548 [Brachionus plicatilis]